MPFPFASSSTNHSPFFYFFSGSLLRRSSKPASLSKSSIYWSGTSPEGSRLNLIVSLNITGSCGITVMSFLKLSIFTAEVSIPSISILPDSISMMRDKARHKVLLPDPVLPTMPIFSPGWTSKLNFWRTSSQSFLYLSSTSLKDSFP